MLRAVFFDIDPTLHDLDTAFEPAVQVVFASVCREAGVDLAKLKHCLHVVWGELWGRFLSGAVQEGLLYREWFGTALPAAAITVPGSALAALAEQYLAAFEAGLCLFPDVRPSLRALRAARPEVVLGLLSNGPSLRQRRRISAQGLDAFFPIRVISEEVGRAKPDRAFFGAALDLAGVAPAEAVMVGDDPRTDIAGAKGAGIRAVWLNRSGGLWPAGLLPVADAEVRALDEALAWVQGWS